MSNIFADFLLNSGMYDETPIKQENIEQLFELIEGRVKIDVYCKECGQKRVFVSSPIFYTIQKVGGTIEVSLGQTLRKINFEYSFRQNPQSGIASDGEAPVEKWIWYDKETEKATRLMCFSFVCTMDETHHLDYIVLTDKTSMMKIGQYPSVADLGFPELEEYKKILSKENLRELRKAKGLFSHGIGVGSFVYLRRVLERMIEKAREMAGELIDAEAYEKSRIVERIKMLKPYLPKLLVDKASIYGIISKGIHELSEEECLRYFPVLETAIFMIASQWEQERRQKEAEATLSQALNGITQSLK